MPRNHDSEQEARMLQAIEAVRNNIFSTINAAARAYNVPRTTLKRRLHGLPSREYN